MLDRINAQLKRQQNFSPFSRLEELAGQTGIRSKIQYMKPIVSTPSDAYEEESVEIKMEGITLEQFIQYLYQIENSPQFMKIKRLHIKPINESPNSLGHLSGVHFYAKRGHVIA